MTALQAPASPQGVVASLLVEYGVVATLLILGIVVAVLLSGRWIQAWLARHAQASVEKELESYRARLQADAEEIRLTNERKLHDFNRYTAERHRVYPKLYRLLLMSEGALNLLWGIRFQRSYKGKSLAQIAEWARKSNFPGEAVGAALSFWESDREKALQMIDNVADEAEHGVAFRNLSKARNYQLVNKLYLSAGANEAVEDAYQTLARYSANARHGDNEDYDKLTEHKSKTHIAVERVRDVMQKELGRGDYETQMTVRSGEEDA